jgi:hypothetical protein
MADPTSFLRLDSTFPSKRVSASLASSSASASPAALLLSSSPDAAIPIPNAQSVMLAVTLRVMPGPRGTRTLGLFAGAAALAFLIAFANLAVARRSA